MANNLVQYPSGSQYVDALQNPKICFRQADLKTSRPDTDKFRRPQPISGNFASVFKLTADSGKRYAIKCFTRHIPDQDVRYSAISQHLARTTTSWKVGFEYQPNGILVGSKWYPILKMDWVDGTSLTSWIDQYVNDPQSIGGLAGRFADLISNLEQEGIAHGDLQHGNLLVGRDGSLRLVDYDGMFVPALDGMRATEQGHRNYQSPLRSNEFHPAIDRFSAWVIYLSLVALAQQPSLWTQLRERNGEYLLLAEEDFTNPTGSARFPFLLNHAEPAIRDLAQKVLKLTTAPTSSIPELEPIGLLTKAAVENNTTQAIVAQSGLRPDHPAWMATHLSSARLVVEHVQFDGRRLSSVITALSTSVLVGIIVLLGVTGSIPVAVGASLVSFLLAAGLAVLGLIYRRRAEVMAAQPARERFTEQEELHERAQRALREVEAEFEQLSKAEAKRTASDQDAKDAIQKRYQDKVAKLDRELQRELARLAADRAAVTRRRQLELDRALEEIQRAYIQTRLRAVKLASAQLDGFGPKLLANLRDVGVATAADFTGVRYTSSGQSTIALIVLSSGREVRVSGIGEVKAARLESWLSFQQQLARNGLPTAISDAERIVIFQRYMSSEHQIDSTEQQARTDTQNKKAELGQRLSIELAQFVDRQKRGNASAAQSRGRLLQRHDAARANLASIGPILQQSESEANAYESITFVHFLRFIITGRHS